jgi:hypothetical protein
MALNSMILELARPRFVGSLSRSHTIASIVDAIVLVLKLASSATYGSTS